MKKRRIAILLHESDHKNTPQRYLISQFVEYWREDGHEVFYLFGTKQFVPADLIFVHIDLSVVPKPYLEFAGRYPVSVNGQVGNIKKSFFSPNILRPDDAWDGPVIVKTDRNAAGVPERYRGGIAKRVRNKAMSMLGMSHSNLYFFKPYLKSQHSYPIYEHLRDVPRYYFFHPGLVVQKFTPERDGDYYCLRYMSFLGDRLSCTRLKGKHPIVSGGTTEIIEDPVEPHPEILVMRKKLQFDYGKFDYVVVNGKPILLDINKTVGCSSNLLDNKEMRERRRYRAEGLYSFFDG